MPFLKAEEKPKKKAEDGPEISMRSGFLWCYCQILPVWAWPPLIRIGAIADVADRLLGELVAKATVTTDSVSVSRVLASAWLGKSQSLRVLSVLLLARVWPSGLMARLKIWSEWPLRVV